ncbi:class I SAM-dependent DNA methyltransferase [Chryseosolibacter indicus]|uniref:Class I SAM-dependent methyltransferase n=1 Tax=Chryseosolibacter indicus TaxID=2782351 RepID=A0ABS5VTN2_9BACT|nr:class I SAM-dependent methyltransferase [Chryseosolibacter indicus]MBT1704576.1 class I SAM-dependent methyltransferase [Chryseosolibacter indicus]
MKENSQFNVYAAFYDLLYKDKDYRGEAHYIDQLITKFLDKNKSTTSLLDLACGTGKHLIELSGKGFAALTGSDISKSMIEVAEKNAEANGKHIKFYNYSFQESDKINATFDVVISMFSAINYLTSYADQSKTLSNVHKLLDSGGLFIFDYWNGCAVTESYSPVKILRKKQENAEIIRISETNLDQVAQSATVKFTCNYFSDNVRLAEFEEIHHLHYYYFSEMKNLLQSHRFEILQISPFMHMDKVVTPQEWNISIIARKIG